METDTTTYEVCFDVLEIPGWLQTMRMQQNRESSDYVQIEVPDDVVAEGEDAVQDWLTDEYTNVMHCYMS